jgi:uncharacterized membrane protein
MKPLIVLLVASFISLGILKIIYGKVEMALAARIGISIMFLFTALGHFMFTDGMAMMLPDFIPFKKELIYVTAFIEIIGAIALHIVPLRPIVSWLLILFLILIIPSNIKASIEQISYQKGTYDGNGLLYLLFRIPLQILFIAWIYLSSLKHI